MIHTNNRISDSAMGNFRRAAFGILLFVGATAQAQDYSLNEIAPPKGYNGSGIYDLNDKGNALVQLTETNEIDQGHSFLFKAGRFYRLADSGEEIPAGAGISGQRLNNSDVIIGWVYKWEEGFFKSAVWSTPGSVKLLPSPRDANFEQYYLESFNDQGKIGGFAAFSGEISRLAGVTIDTLSGELQIDEEHLIFSLNNRGSILRSGSMDNAAAAELVRPSGSTPIVTPALHREPNDPKLAEDDVIFGSATDDDGSDGMIGTGSDCVIWKAPNFTPLLINPPGKLQSDDCWITSRNRAGQMLMQHDRHDQYDELIFSKLYLTDGRTFRSLEALHPDLAKFDRLYLVKINANGQIALNGYKDGSVRGLILTPRAKGAAPNPRFVN